MFQGRCNNYHAGEVQNDLRGGAHLPTPPLCEQLVVKCRELQPLQKKTLFHFNQDILHFLFRMTKVLHIARLVEF